MTAKEFFESQLLTDASSIIDKTRQKYSRFDLIKFAEIYGKKQYNQAIDDLVADDVVANKEKILLKFKKL